MREPDSPRRAAQLDRLLSWSPIGWSDHIDIVLDVIDERQRSPRRTMIPNEVVT